MTGFFSGFPSDGKILIINSTQQKKKVKYCQNHMTQVALTTH
jgi:hypothetical protein